MASPSRFPSANPVPVSSSPAPSQQRSVAGSLPRADLTARLAEPIPAGSPLQRSGSPRPSIGAIDNASPLAAGNSSFQGPGVSALAAALSDLPPPRHGTPPVRAGTPPIRSQSPFGHVSATPTNYGSFDSRRQGGANNAPYEDPEIVKRHLVLPTDADNPPSEESSLLGRASFSSSGSSKRPAGACTAPPSMSVPSRE
jgi:proton-coupled amino acid transporter